MSSKTPQTDWLNDRQQSIGGSDAAAILGASRFSTALQVYYSKRGLTDPKPMDESRLEIGLAMEIVLADLARRRLFPDYEVLEGPHEMAEALNDSDLEFRVYDFKPKGARLDASQILVRRKGFPHLHATPDALIRHKETGKLWSAEWKSCSEFMRDEFRDGTPEYYKCQGRHNAAVMGLEGCYCAVIIGTAEFQTDFVPGFEKPDLYLFDTQEWYLKHPLAGNEPEAVAEDDKSPSFLNRVNDGRDAEMVKLPLSLAGEDERYCDVERDLKPLTKEKATIRAKIKQAIGKHRGGILPDGSSWRIDGRGAMKRYEAE